jgi:catechol 2,3-dioxygenase-like lactoylglutathione lyase family enzyme
MINGCHCVIFSRDAEADRAFFRDVLGMPFVDSGEGWLIFALPPSEVSFHPAEENDRHQLYLLCDDLPAMMEEMEERGVHCSEPAEQSWGTVTSLPLPGGGQIGLYQPKHPLASSLGSSGSPSM